MVFSSITFLVFFLLFFPIYWRVNDRNSVIWRNLLVIAGSYLFYGWWDWRFLILIVVSSLADYQIGQRLGNAQTPGSRKLLAGLSLAVNLGILGYFKYANFFIDSMNHLLASIGLPVSGFTLNIILPVGISFYTFQTLSYTLDIYHRRIQPTRDPVAFFAFVSFFPQLVAGPIERASHLLPQFAIRHRFSYDDCKAGLRLILWGLFKKLVIADNFGRLADLAFAPQDGYSGILTLAGTACFAIQIYADFSGYSDMAIGLARMLGFDLRKNFVTPYLARSFGEFWHRWHISLSTWFRDYVYIPLGGSRESSGKTYRNLLVTFVISGLWHGANVTFLIWGFIHGLMLVLEKMTRLSWRGMAGRSLLLLLLILFWLPFRAVDSDQLWAMSWSLVNLPSWDVSTVSILTDQFPIRRLLALGIAAIGFWWIERQMRQHDFHEWIKTKSIRLRMGLYYGLILAILLLTNFDARPTFIYFQF